MKKSNFTGNTLDPDKDPFCINLSVIANSLILLERNILWIGIPILPLLRLRLEPPSEFFYPIGDFIRANLVTIPTKDLVSAREFLSSRAENSTEAEFFLSKFRKLSLFDYLYFPLLTCVVIFILTITTIFPFSYSLRSLILISILSGIGGTLGSLLFYLEPIRFFSFIKILDGEILRRSGNIPNKNITPIPNTAFSRVKQQ